MAVGADLDVDLGLGRPGHELVAARAADVRLDVVGVDAGLHAFSLAAVASQAADDTRRRVVGSSASSTSRRVDVECAGRVPRAGTRRRSPRPSSARAGGEAGRPAAQVGRRRHRSRRRTGRRRCGRVVDDREAVAPRPDASAPGARRPPRAGRAAVGLPADAACAPARWRAPSPHQRKRTTARYSPAPAGRRRAWCRRSRRGRARALPAAELGAAHALPATRRRSCAEEVEAHRASGACPASAGMLAVKTAKRWAASAPTRTRRARAQRRARAPAAAAGERRRERGAADDRSGAAHGLPEQRRAPVLQGFAVGLLVERPVAALGRRQPAALGGDRPALHAVRVVDDQVDVAVSGASSGISYTPAGHIHAPRLGDTARHVLLHADVVRRVVAGRVARDEDRRELVEDVLAVRLGIASSSCRRRTSAWRRCGATPAAAGKRPFVAIIGLTSGPPCRKPFWNGWRVLRTS